MYGIDARRKTALDDGIEIIGRCDNPGVVVYLPTERVDFIPTDLYKIVVRLAVIFSSSQYRVVSELIVCREVGFYLCILGRATPAIVILLVVYIACICFSFHYFLELVSKSEVRVRMRNFQAFRGFLHNVASVCGEILRKQVEKKSIYRLIKQKSDGKKKRLAEISMSLFAFRCSLLLQQAIDH